MAESATTYSLKSHVLPYRMAEYAIICPNERHAMARSGQVKGRFRAAFEWQMADSSKHRADKWQHELLRLRAEKG